MLYRIRARAHSLPHRACQAEHRAASGGTPWDRTGENKNAQEERPPSLLQIVFKDSRDAVFAEPPPVFIQHAPLEVLKMHFAHILPRTEHQFEILFGKVTIAADKTLRMHLVEFFLTEITRGAAEKKFGERADNGRYSRS